MCRYTWNHIVDGASKEVCNQEIIKEMIRIQNFVLWHYQFGSKFDTPFWNYAKSLHFSPDEEFNTIFSGVKNNEILNPNIQYAQWGTFSFKNWIENT